MNRSSAASTRGRTSKQCGEVAAAPEDRSGVRVQSEGALRDLFEFAPDAIVAIDRGGHIVMVNEQTEKMFGYAQAELVGQPLDILLPERFRATHSGSRDRFLSNPVARQMGARVELWGRRKDGTELPLDIGLGSIRGFDQMIVTAFIRDITEQKQFEGDLKMAKDAAEAASAAKLRFLASMSHEFRTPMNGILGMIGLLSDSALSSEQEDWVEALQESADHLMALVNDISDIAKIEAGELELVEAGFKLSDLVEDCTAALSGPARAKGLKLGHEVAGMCRMG